MRLHAVSLLTLGAALLASAPAQAQDTAWTGEQIRANWSGKKLLFRSTAGLTEMRMRADGGADVVAANGMSDTGQWRVNDKAYCVKWQKFRSGEERCFGVIQRGDKVHTVGPDGAITAELVRVID
jgi:hypothetical protein